LNFKLIFVLSEDNFKYFSYQDGFGDINQYKMHHDPTATAKTINKNVNKAKKQKLNNKK